LQREKEDLETELYEVRRRCEDQVDTLNTYEESIKSLKMTIKGMAKKLKEKDRIIEENKKSLSFYTERYMNDERGRASENKNYNA
jgi:phosphoribosyl-dephospho-CoA transferase